MLASRDLDRRITIERAIEVENDLGEVVQSWLPVATVWAKVMPISDAEQVRAREVAARMTTRFWIRWGLDVTPKDRVIFDGRTYVISGVKELGRRVGQEITAAARAE